MRLNELEEPQSEFLFEMRPTLLAFDLQDLRQTPNQSSEQTPQEVMPFAYAKPAPSCSRSTR